MNITAGTVAKYALRLVISSAASAAIIYLLFKGILKMESGLADQVLYIIRNISTGFLAVFAVLNLSQAAVRAIRYRMLISAGNREIPPSYPHTLLVTLARNMFVDMFPARAGELSYIAMMQAGFKVSAQACLSSLIVSFIFDVLSLACLVLSLLTFPVYGESSPGPILKAFAVIAILSIILFLFVYRGLGFTAALFADYTKRHPNFPLLPRIAGLIDKTAAAVKETARKRIFAKTLVLSLLVRICKYLGLYFLFLSIVNVPLHQYADTPASAVVGSFLSAEALTSLPLPVFLGFGTYEAGGSAAFALCGIVAVHAGLIILSAHIVSQVFDYIAGIVALVFMIFRARTAATSGESRCFKFLRSTAPFLLIALCFSILIYSMTRMQEGKRGPQLPPDRGSSLSVPEITDIAGRKATLPRGFVVWSSNRSGNHEIYMLSMPDMESTQLTRNEHVDYFPRISPDGTRLVFARSKDKWVSQRNAALWDVYILDLATGKESLLASDANHPTWSRDGKLVFFSRKGTDVISISPETRKETAIFSASSDKTLTFCTIETPSVADDMESVAVTIRGARRMTGIIRSGRLTRTGDGCQLTWMNDSGNLCFVDDGGRQKNTFYMHNPRTGKTTKWHDNPGSYSHEYFPKLSDDGRYLVYGASTGGHEHDAADYEIFLWNIKDADDKAVRLTYHTGNDCWPDAFIFPSK